MQPITDTTPATAHPHAVAATGTGAQASTPAPDQEALRAYTLASVAHLQATAVRWHAEICEHASLAACHRADPYLLPADRMLLAAIADQRAENARVRAQQVEDRVNRLLASIGGDVPATAEEPIAVVVITIQRDRVHQTARLVMGGTRSVTRRWDRISGGSWGTKQREWIHSERQLGIELAEYMDALDFPSRVADMLPRPPATGSNAATKAAEEVRNG
jgi:hypothetical protein